MASRVGARNFESVAELGSVGGTVLISTASKVLGLGACAFSYFEGILILGVLINDRLRTQR